MKARFIHDGKAIDYTPTAATPAGSVVVLEDMVGITKLDIAANSLGALHLTGVYDIEKASGAIATGKKIYWNKTDKNATTIASYGSSPVIYNVPMGYAVADAGADDETVRVRIG
jgi:predicted RecA/RadA family phage recombinase